MHGSSKTHRALSLKGRLDDYRHFVSKIDAQSTACWRWRGACTSANSHGRGGYGRFWLDGREVLAHRVAYETYKGPIPDGYTVDHRCNNPSCVNPAHLSLATPRDNILRGNGVFAQNARKTHCKRGHAFTPENTGQQKGGRFCRTCRRADYRRFRAKQRRSGE